jgi:hypothetical protein
LRAPIAACGLELTSPTGAPPSATSTVTAAQTQSAIDHAFGTGSFAGGWRDAS